MPLRLLLILPLFFIFSTQAVSQTEPWPRTFLWKISGNGLTVPSYLFGTMQIEDKRLFHFPDSVYHAIRSTSGFATEIDMHEVILAMVDPNNETHELITIDRQALHPSVDSFLYEMGIGGNKISRKLLLEIRKKRINRVVDSLLPMIPDGLLFSVATALGKETAGISKFSEEISSSDVNEILMHQALAADEVLRNDIDNMVRIYRSQDLSAINDCVECGSEVSKSPLTWLRMKRMADRMDSMMNSRSWFFNVAVALLPGDHGIISYLREIGYHVEPVFSNTSVNALKYYEGLSGLRWRNITEPGYYSADFPGSPVEYSIYGPALRMKILFDIPTANFYALGYTLGYSDPSSTEQETIISVFKKMAEKMGGTVSKLDLKVIENGNDLILEDSFTGSSNAHFKLRLIRKGMALYFLMHGFDEGVPNDHLSESRFFSSFQATFKPEVVSPTVFSVPGKGFSIELPGTPGLSPAMNPQNPAPGWKYTSYVLVEKAKGTTYLIQIQELFGPSFVEGDTNYFNNYWKNLHPSIQIIDKQPTFVQGWPAFTIDFVDNMQSVGRILTVLRGKRIYFITGIAQKPQQAEVEKVLSTFRLVNIPNQQWSMQSGDGFATFAPSRFEKQEHQVKANYLLPEGPSYFSFDSLSMISCEIYVAEVSVKKREIGELLEHQVKAFMQYGDLVRLKNTVEEGDIRGIDFELQRPGGNIVRKFRVLLKNQKLYILHTAVPGIMLADEHVQRFFTDFQIRD